MGQFEIAERIAERHAERFADSPSRITMRDENKRVRKLRALTEKRQRIDSRKPEGIAEGPLAGIREIEAGCNRDKRRKIKNPPN